MTLPSFAELAAAPEPPLDALALALAAEFRQVEPARALERLDELGRELAAERDGEGPEAELDACRRVLGARHGFRGDRERYDRPDNSMLDLVLERRLGLPILLSVLYVEVARRAGIALAGVGLPGHFVVGHFGGPGEPLLADPFAGGGALALPAAGTVRPWGPHETALRMLSNLVASYAARADLGRALHAARLRLLLPLDDGERERLELGLRRLSARLN